MTMYHFFLRHFLRNPKNVGAVAPFSQSVASQLTKGMRYRKTHVPWRILEVGAGAGNITRTIVEEMQPSDTLDVIEIDKTCCNLLKEMFSQDGRVSIQCLSILDWTPSLPYDFIISTLPLNSFSADLVAKIFSHFQKIGAADSLYVYVEYMGLERLRLAFGSERSRQAILERRALIQKLHRQYLIKKRRVLTNFLPCYVYVMTLHPNSNAGELFAMQSTKKNKFRPSPKR